MYSKKPKVPCVRYASFKNTLYIMERATSIINIKISFNETTTKKELESLNGGNGVTSVINFAKPLKKVSNDGNNVRNKMINKVNTINTIRPKYFLSSTDVKMK